MYLPPGYNTDGPGYPVVYLQDGQNLFDPGTAFGGQDWYADYTADQLIYAGSIEPVILVGVYNTGVRRISEYTPTRDPRRRKGGKGDRYSKMLARELKPFIDREYHTRRSAAHTGVGGSSLGGLVSLEAGLLYPRVFGNLAVLSPSIWWDERAVVAMVEAYAFPVRPRIWLDAGTEEGDSPQHILEDLRHLRNAFLAKGWREGEDLHYWEIPGARHNELAWGGRLGQVLQWLVPK